MPAKGRQRQSRKRLTHPPTPVRLTPSLTPLSDFTHTRPVPGSMVIFPSCHFFCFWVRRLVYRQLRRCSVPMVLCCEVGGWVGGWGVGVGCVEKEGQGNAWRDGEG